MTTTRSIDYLIIGQGIAGTMMAHAARERGCSVQVIDAPQPQSATQVSAGLMNPITGRKFVKSWLVDALLPAAKTAYARLGEQLGYGESYFRPRPIIRALAQPKDQNNWEVRASMPGYAGYIGDEDTAGEYAQRVVYATGYGVVQGGGRVAVQDLLQDFRARLLAEGLLWEESMVYDALTFERGKVQYRGLEARYLVCCEGIGVQENPYFSYLPVQGNKGEVLRIRIPGFEPAGILKQQLFFVPMGGDEFWVGSTYFNAFEDATPSKRGRAALLEKLESVLQVPYEILDHQAAVRPTVPDRRPLIGRHPAYEQLVLFNGMGTKGASLAPYWAAQLVQHLEEGTPLDEAVGHERYPVREG